MPRKALIHDHQRVTQILEAVRAGVPMKTAAEAGGITYDALNKWRRRGADALALIGEHHDDYNDPTYNPDNPTDDLPIPPGIPPDDQPYVRLFLALRRARAQGLAALVVLWRKQAASDWRAAAALLAVHDPGTYAQRSRLDLVSSHSSLDALPPGEGDAVVEQRQSADIERAAEVLSVLADNGLLDALEAGVPDALPVSPNGDLPVIDVDPE